MKKISKQFVLSVFCSTALMWSAAVSAENGFIVRDIKVIGAQRVSTGTVLNYLPVQVGEEITPASTPQIIRALYDTGFFQSVVLERQGNTLIVRVIERATVGSINVTGNSEIPSDKMKEILKDLGLVKGRVFQRASLERLEKELKQAYNARGKYNARIESNVTALTENRVAINVSISEGRVSRIKEIRIIGNHDFTESELLSEMSLTTSNLFTYFSKKDQYSKAAMDASLEALRSYYLDRGYLKFKIVSSQVLLSPDKKDVFINIHIEEGPQYHFAGYEIRGKTILPREKIDSLIQVRKGDVFSRKKVTESISAVGLALGDVGFGFPAINAEPQIDEQNKTVLITFVIDPGRHVYVRRINFHGNTKTGDYVLRNIIRQQEGALLSLHNIKESERQLRLLSYLKNINVKTTPVPEANNQVDLDVYLEEAPSAEASASLGYGTTGPQFNAAFDQYNFMGTGRAVGLAFNASNWGQNYSFNYYNPFYTNTGIGRGVNLYFQTVDPKQLDVAAYSSDRFGGDVNYNILLSENSSMQLGYGYQGLNIKSVGTVQQIQNFVDLYGRNFDQIRLSSGWNRNTYDQMPYPTRGTNQQAGLLVALPGSSDSFKYYKTSYLAKMYYPITRGFIFTALGNVAYGNTFNNQGLPFFENYFAGGIAQPGQVRGYESYSLGPQDNTGRALGANFLVNGSAGLILPYPLSRDNVRTTLFVDAGNVFVRGTPVALAGTDAGPLRYSTGVSVEWRSPFGPLAFSVAQALNAQPTDEKQFFQFTLSSSF
ncbi:MULTISPECIES: outer membrane protein assembly factor BamA [Legionella]|uniref:Outer membrane protein assembly factor BamA n=1 Tax=Legionella septentrionalis TaxID=2498109 RepID=A0A3S1CLD5_9GAMM|nr:MULTISPECIES: outer membrane protein assembly factor BamA [Legionella]MCP0913174.1 outer membrane protein assembly factor BamA [Legionella sp. 27cVA30]RUQ88063.1 outer membrane protein assembly factor BamA [Legionella septentrionalis]RUR02442.1 outer membrane protein assembly factor BamA [Legionella septentrionalis]RUR09299.1 outer membrane protein assembly factor BamA [Legionella septentrionalis]RUR17100.1 outer membrane protein assembly factor BamA [Legionella septentrionalis]